MAVVTAPSTKERLVAAAIDVFRRDGYERARVQDIARAAGLTTGAIYANYRGKAELLSEAITERTVRELEQLWRQSAAQSAREVLARLADRLLREDDERPLILEAVAASARDPELADMLRASVADRESRFAALVERAKERGEIDDTIATEVMARFCVMLAFGGVVFRTLGIAPGDPHEWHLFIDRLLGAVAPQPGASA
jgi:AcrR family transcriptional regulator